MILANMGSYVGSKCSLGIGAAHRLMITNKNITFSILGKVNERKVNKCVNGYHWTHMVAEHSLSNIGRTIRITTWVLVIVFNNTCEDIWTVFEY